MGGMASLPLDKGDNPQKETEAPNRKTCTQLGHTHARGPFGSPWLLFPG